MIRGTTPTNVFNVDIDLTNAIAIYITYRQPRKLVAFEKSIHDIEVSPTSLSVKLTQEDTLKLKINKQPFPTVKTVTYTSVNGNGEVTPIMEDDSNVVEIQIRAKFADGTAVASEIIKTTVEEILKEGVI